MQLFDLTDTELLAAICQFMCIYERLNQCWQFMDFLVRLFFFPNFKTTSRDLVPSEEEFVANLVFRDLHFLL